MLHLAFGGVGFLGLIAACVILARRFQRQGARPWAWFSLITGAVSLGAFAGIASGGAPGRLSSSSPPRSYSPGRGCFCSAAICTARQPALPRPRSGLASAPPVQGSRA